MFRTTLLASVATAACLTVPGLALAQSKPAITAAATTAAKGVEVGEIVVTGSRIPRNDLTSVQPIQVITSETMDRKGFTNVADALNEMPSAGIPISPIGDQGSFGTGRNFVNIFNLGSNRTLVLVNGRRFVGGNPASIFTGANGGAQVDLNSIPTGLVDRIETVQAGGSAVYGSDAIAGVINIITKTEYEGVEVDGLYGVSDKGDAESWRGRIIGGHKFMDGRLSLMGSYEYNQTQALAFTDRDVTARQIAFANNPLNTSGTDNIPGQIIIFNRRISELTQGGLPWRNNGATLANQLTIVDPNNPLARVPAQFAPNGTLVPFNQGQFFSSSVESGGDGLNLAPLSSLQSPVKRHVLNGFGKFELTDNIRLSTELLYSKATSVEPFNQPIFNASLFGGTSGPLQFSTANPFLSAATRAQILGQPTALPADPRSPGDVLFFLDRASTDIGSNKTSSESETWRGVFAIDGDGDFSGHKYFWNASANFGENKGSFQSPNIDQSKFALAVDVTRDAAGNAVCRDLTARAAGCQPLNLFGLGAPSTAALNYVQVQFVSDFAIKETDYQANFGGDIWQLPAGAWSGAVGYEYRKEQSDFEPNDPQRLGIGRSAAITAITGEFHTDEWYAETSVPVFGKDFSYPFMRRLEFDASYRRINNSVAGQDKAWQYGGRWAPFEDLTFRAQKSRSFRAPAITETSLPVATSFFTATDPCDKANINGGPSPATRAANCAADFAAAGLPANFQLTSLVQSRTVQGTTAGNPNLKNEVADQYTIGAVYQPHWLPGFEIHADWVHIDLTKAIANFNLTSILQVCYDSPSRPADACGRFQRGLLASGANAGQILSAGDVGAGGAVSAGPSTGFINAGYIHFEGATGGASYRANLADWGANFFNGDPGALNFKLDIYHLKRFETSVTGLGFDLNRDQGEIGVAKYQGKLETEYVRKPFSLTWTLNFIARSKFNNDFTPETRFPLTVAPYWLNDLALTYDLGHWTEMTGLPFTGAQARLIVHNVGDVEPPFGTTGIGVYDVIGRYYQVGLTAKF
ncbi:TonB-dependent receptor domain-containing protein [Phenylobacterium sp.]|uniref:TonB-dependent receptor domain-containing protein n=1 Tax=Phenylobacterium sp. TaxID=1871053 RepID=UPI00356A1D12